MPYIDQFLQANPEFANKDENALAEALYNAHFKDEGTLDEFKAEFLGSKESTLQDIGAAAGTAPIKLAQVVAGIPAGVSDAVTWAANKAASGLGLAPPNYTGRDNPIVAGSRALSDSLGKLADAVGEELHTDEFNRKAKAEAARPDKGTIGGLWDAATSGDMDLLKKQANANWEDVKDAAAFYGNNPLHGFAAGVESAPMMLAPMAAAKMAGGAGLSATKAAIATGSAMEGASAASGTRMRIDDMSVDDLSLVSPEFNNLLMQGMAPETAKSELARLAGGEAFTISAIASGIASKLTGAGKFEADVGAGGVGGVFKGGLRGGATEFPQEFIESGAGQYAENQAIKDFANSEQNLSQGVLKAATQGGIVGMGTGATVGAARGLFGSNPIPTEQTDNRPDVTGKDGTDLLGNQGNSNVIDDHLKRTQDELKAFEQQEAEALNAGLAQAVQNAQTISAQNQQAAVQPPAPLMPQDPELQAMAAQGVPVVEITPPVQEQPQSKVKAKPKPEPVTPFDEVAEDAQAPEQNAFKGLPIQELPVDKLTLSNDVPQFKDGANESGVVEPLGGKFDRTGVAPIQVWQRNDGRMEVISGRHRLDLARRSGESTIPVQVHREADGFDADRASTLDAELNIRDGQGKVADYVQYFTKSGIDKETANNRGLLSRAIGKRAYAIATQGDSELIAAHRANVATDLGAYTIATAFPNDGKRQQVALARLQQGDNVEKAVNVARALSAITGGDSNMDMFGFDDAAIKEAERMAKEAVSIQRQITNDIAAVQGAAKNPKAAAKFGVNVSDPDGVKKRIEELKEERAQWDNWHTNPALVARLRGDDAQAAEPIAQTQPNTAQDDFLTSYDESTIQSQEANAKALAQQQAAQQNKEAIDAGVDNFSLDMDNVPDDDGGATFDMFSDPVPVAQPKPTQAPTAVETVTPTYDTISDNQEIVPSKSGEPFKSEKLARLSTTFKNTPNAEIKQIGDKQFVVVKAKQEAVTQKVEAQAQPKFETDIKQANQTSYEQIKSEMLNNGWEVDGDKLKKTIQTDNNGELSDGSRIVYASHKNGAVQLEYGFNSQQVPFNTYNNDPVKTIADVERRMTKLVPEVKKDKPAQEAKADKQKSTEQAEAEAMIAEGLDELMSLLGGKMNMTPEQESQIIPIMAKLFRGFAKLGYIKFKDAAAKVLETIESKLGKEIADQISIDNLQAGYINIASEIGGNKKDALMVESIDELRNSEATNNVTANDTSNVLEQDSQDATTQNAVGKKRVQAESGRDGRSDGQRDQGSGSQASSNDVGSSTGVAGYETPVTGERGNIEVYTGSNARTETSSTGSDIDSGSSNDSYDGVPIEPVGATTPATATTSLGERVLIREQQKKLSKGKQTDGIESIREELPFLLPPQQEDVAKAETIYQEPTGYGMLFTNGTGTGKTFTGLGIVKRFANRGKTNTLIIAPSEQIIKQWVDAARDFFALTVNQLENTVSAGKGIVITTYANLTANNELAKRDWDLVVADEAQRLLMNESGEPTGAIKNFRAITNHKRGAITRTEMLHHELYAELKQVQSDLKGAKAFDNDAYLPEIARLEAKQNKLLDQIQAKRAEVDTQVAATQGEKRSRTLFLSATPFAYEKTIDWAEGYLFDYAEGSSKESDGQAYNSGNTKDQFFMRHFGYRMRFNKLTEPDVGVDRGLMQRQFNTWLKKKGVLSGRMLEVDADYDRKFVLVNSGIGTRIDEALRWLSDKSRSGNTAASELSKELNDKFDYLSRQYLLEAIKAKEVIAHIKEHLALGRKVVVFHDFIKGGGVNPFRLGEYSGDPERESLLREFNSEFRDLINSSAFNASSPIETLSEAFPDLLLFNGRVPKNVRKDNVTKFQDDASGPKVILVQSAAGKEGISLHDTTGKHQRVLFNLGQPTQPTTAIQQEGRIYRTGQKSDAIIRYLNTGTNWEKFAFATKIAERASAAENLGMGELARALKDAFISAFDQSDDYRAGMENEGKGGKELDKAANNALTEYDRARAFYFANQKKTSKNKAAEGVDYFATPEPVGLKMVEMADIRIGESALEPSAGHGAIARWMPSYAKVKAIEPSLELQSRLAMNVNADSIIGSTFEAFNVVNKFDAIVMNPPFGVGGKTAIEHLDKASKHLRNGGRIVALIPSGAAADKRFNAWLYGNEKEEGVKDFYLVADVLLPTSTFERAGTQVATHIVVLEKQTEKAKVEQIRQHGIIDYRSADSVKDLFDRMEFLSINPRAVDAEKPADYQAETSSNQSSTNVTPASHNGNIIEHTTKAGKVIRGVVRTDLTQEQAKKIDEFTFKKDGGYFIREKHLASLANMDGMVKFSFAGRKAKTANLDNLANAEARIAAGEDAEVVRQETGWHQGVDGKWRFEIDDSGAKLKVNVLNADEVNEHQTKIDSLKNTLVGILARDDLTNIEKQRAKSNADVRLKMLEQTAPIKKIERALTKRVRTIGELLDHPELLSAYPSVGEIKVAYSDDAIGRKQEKGEYGSYNPETNEIRLNVNLDEKEILSTLMHEIQHAIQEEENFARGGNQQDFESEYADDKYRAQELKEKLLRWENEASDKADWADTELKDKAAKWAEEQGEFFDSATDKEKVKEYLLAHDEIYKRAYKEHARLAYGDGKLEPFERYKRLTGEVEARNTQKRLGMNAQERKLTAPSATQDVPNEKQIVRFDGGRADYAPRPETLTKQQATDIISRDADGKRLLKNGKVKVLGSMDEAPAHVLEQAKRSEVASDTIMVDGVERPTRNSNGQLIHPTKQGIENFWRWFGDSQVVDADGKPLVVYHGTKRDFNEFKLNAAPKTDDGWFGDGFYTTAVQSLADNYAMRDPSWELTDEPANTMPLYVKAEYPYTIDAATSGGMSYEEGSNFTKSFGGKKGFKQYLDSNGYDSVILQRDKDMVGDGADFYEIVSFDANAIKSAIGNNGDFDHENKNILYSQDGNIQGFFDPATDTTYLVADALTADTINGVLVHEVGVHAWWRNADKATREALGNRAAKLIEHGIEFGNERLKAFYSGVQSRLVEAKVVGNNEEAFAYLAEEAINEAKAGRYALSDSRFIDAIAKVSTRLANLMSDAIAYLKSSMHRLGWLDTDKLTGADLVAIAKRNMREVANGKPTDPSGGGKGVKFSIQQNQNQLADQIDEIQKAVDEQRSKVLNRLKVSGVDHAGWMLGIPNLKQLADIAKHKLPQIQEYTEITDRMAGYRNKLMTESGDIANDVRKWVGKNRAAANRLFDLMHEATISGIDPSEPYKAMDLSLLKQKQAHLDIMQGLSDDHAAEIDALEKQIQYELSGERRADYDALAKKWALIPNGGRRVFQLMRDHYKLRALQTQKELLARIARSGLDDEMKQTSMGALRLQFESTMNSGVYFPLARFGEYWLSGNNPKGEREFRMYDNESERRTAERKMIDLGYTDVASGVKLDANALEAGANGAFVSDAISKLDEALGEDAKQLKDDIYQFYLQSLPDMSMRKAFIHRKKTKGYSADALRAFAQKTFHMAHQLSKLRHSDQLTDKLDSIRKEAAKGDVMKGRFYNEMVKRHNWVLNPTDSEKSSKLTGLGFLWYLGASPAAAAVNTTQLVVTTLPVLSADHGSKAFSELGKGMKDAVSDKNLAADELAMMTLFTEEGVIETTMAHDLAGMADTETGKYNEKWAQAMSVVSWMFHKAEVFNRRATALAAYRLAKSSNHADPVGYARQKIWETQFDYSNSNRARWMQANWVKVVTLFKQYALNMSYFIVKNTKEAITGTDLIGQTLSTQERKIAKRKIIGLTIATLAMGGLAATPFYFAILALAGMAGDDDEDSRDTLHDMLSDWFGEDWARFILKGGVNATSGVDISSRMATDLLGLWYRTNDEAKDEAEWTQQFFIQQLGPVFGIAINVGEGIVKIKKGEIERGAEQMVPKSIKDLMQAARFANEGALTLGGDKDYAGTVLVDEFNAWQLFMKANGFTPEELSNRYDANSRFIRKDKAIKERRAGILTEYWTAFRNDDKEAMNAIIKKDVMEFNAKYPQFAIDGDTLSSSIKTRIKGMQGMENGVYVSHKMKAYMEQNNN